MERFSARKSLDFSDPVKYLKSTFYKVATTLDRPILLRPGYNYTIIITFETEPLNLYNVSHLKSKVRVDHDIVFRFLESRSVVTSFILNRLENRKYIRKIIHNPMMWFIMILVLVVIIFLMKYDINQKNSKLNYLWKLIKALFVKSSEEESGVEDVMCHYDKMHLINMDCVLHFFFLSRKQ